MLHTLISTNNMNINKYTTVTISQSDNEKLTTFCRNNDITKKDFITLSLSYFEREGINPKSHESPKSEIEKVIKRLDHFFAFFKKQEQEYIRPLILDFAEDKKNRDKINSSMINNQKLIYKRISDKAEEINEKVVSETKEQLKPIQESLKENTNSAGKDRTKNQDEMKKEIKELKEGMQLLVEFMDEKNKRGLMNKMNKLFG